MEGKNKGLIAKLIYVLSFMIFIGFTFVFMKNNILPMKHRLILFAAIGLFYFLGGLAIFSKKIPNLLRSLLGLVFLATMLGLSFAALFGEKSAQTIKDMNKQQSSETIKFSFIVKKDSPLQGLVDIADKEVYTAIDRDKENIEAFKKSEGDKYKLADGVDYATTGKNLLDGKYQVMLLNETYRPLVEELIDGFSEKTKVIGEVEVIRSLENTGLKVIKESINEIKDETKPENTEGSKNTQGFNIYLSGIDSYGGLSVRGRSDVNLIVSVNPKLHKIQITTIPRDSYVPIAGSGQNQYDKLTHAGIYGVKSSQETLENFLGISIDYYARVNFSSLVDIVDSLGGVEVYSEQSFITRHGKHSISKGINKLSGNQAVGFARERYSLNNGDFDRGRNHMKIVEAIIKKLMSPSILFNYEGILNSILHSTQTDMPYEKIIELVNGQIASGGGWQIEKQDVRGSGRMGLPSYAMPGWKLYMFVPSKASVNQISNNINNLVK